ncbi:hypothetical protein MGYG_03439 [Nannizzia gypsea CBS 118893]|uniref:Uncharacterized protein n=1 Tax=Arthroderma gypseum (strain ATCC MYA-4604 / CBS 118893) TaxID=535722 RepID=E4URW5_ARTGP|nr:hypothetical protein MGYG_03439 [Nannizzia gypsea CBS 118893]EFR00436.1 hypothetical protein MGYG_03439 [Nannizzia gypsea CBS 118893]
MATNDEDEDEIVQGAYATLKTAQQSFRNKRSGLARRATTAAPLKPATATTEPALREVTFEAVDSTTSDDYTYVINSSSSLIRSSYNLPITQTLFLSPDRTIDPPSAKLLALHRTIARIMEPGAAGAYVDKIIRDMEEIWVRSDGSAELGSFEVRRVDGCGHLNVRFSTV